MTTSQPVVTSASLGRRAGAYAIDLGIACGIGAVLAGIVVVIVVGSAASGDPTAVALAAVAGYAVTALAMAAWWLVYSGMQGGNGSIGQRALGLRLQDADTGAPIGFWRAVLRNVVWALAGSILIGYFTPLLDASPRRQGWHDMAARATVTGVRPTVPTPPAARGSSAGPTAAGRNPYVPQAPLPSYGIFSAAPVAEPAPAPVLESATAPVVEPATAPVLVPALVGADAGDVDATRIPAAVPPPAQRAALYPEAPVLTVLTWDDGTRMAVYGRTLYGRNPPVEHGAVAIAVRDETLSLSKTHFEIGGETGAAWVADRHSTNGTVLVRDGARIPLVPGLRTSLRGGDRLEFGDRSARVGDA